VTIQGGGGGKKIPPGGPPVPPKAQKAEASTPGTKAPAKDAPTVTKPAGKDAFVPKSDAGPFKSTTDVRLDDAFLHAVTPSGIENLVRMLESARTQLLGEHSKGRIEAQKLLEKLVQAGFSEAQLSSTRQELYELRKRMAAVRKRLQHLTRRLKSAFAQAGRTADANLQKTLSAQLERFKRLEPGLSKSLGALTLIEQAYSGFADGSPPVLRARVEERTDNKGSAELVSAFAALAPGAVASHVLLGVLRAGHDATPSDLASSASASVGAPRVTPATDGEPAALGGLRAFARALTGNDEER
jgi:hypothetical protein